MCSRCYNILWFIYVRIHVFVFYFEIFVFFMCVYIEIRADILVNCKFGRTIFTTVYLQIYQKLNYLRTRLKCNLWDEFYFLLIIILAQCKGINVFSIIQNRSTIHIRIIGSEIAMNFFCFFFCLMFYSLVFILQTMYLQMNICCVLCFLTTCMQMSTTHLIHLLTRHTNSDCKRAHFWICTEHQFTLLIYWKFFTRQ